MAAPQTSMDPAETDRRIYAQVFDNALVGICFMRDRHFLRVNARMEEMLGYAPGELAGQSVRLLYARPEDFEEVGRVVADFPANNRYEHERPLIAKDGRLLCCLISGRMVDPGVTHGTSVWVVQDITEKKEAEGELARANQRLEQTIEQRTRNLQKINETLKLEVERRRESERVMIESREKYRVLIRNMPLGLVITDADEQVIETNPAVLAMFDAHDMHAFRVQAMRNEAVRTAEGDRLSLQALIARESPPDSRRIGHAVVSWAGKDGAMRWFDVVGVRVPVRGLGAALVFSDRTEARQAREREHAQHQQLAHATRLSMMGQFASALAHELGQPLNACQSYAAGIAHRLREEFDARPDSREALNRLQAHLAQAGDVIRNVRAFIASHRPVNETVNFAALVGSTLELLQIPLRQNGVQVNVNVPANLPTLRGNRVELQQVLVNLLINAIEAMRDAKTKHPAIRIRVQRASASRLRATVTDNGPGLPADLLERIFQPYISTKRDGLGMGLMMCRTIIESHGGTLTPDSRRRRGASFSFVLPWAAEEAAT
jgi:PAS domain S-box-containing protein